MHSYAYRNVYAYAKMYVICISHLLFFEMFLNLNVSPSSLWRSVPHSYFSSTGFTRETSRIAKDHILGEIYLFLTILQELQKLRFLEQHGKVSCLKNT